MSDYSDKLKSPKWQRRRLEIMKRDKFKCKKCGDEETTLNVHHKIYKKGVEPWEYENSELVTLCEHCHIEIEELIDENKDGIEFDNVKIHKANNWSTGKRIMFIAYNSFCSMMIYSKENAKIIGFKFSDYTIPSVIKIFKKAL